MLTDKFIPTPGHGYDGNILNSLNTFDGDPYGRHSVIHNPSIRRPYFDSRGYPCVTVHTGRWTVNKGVRYPVKERRRIVDLMNAGWVDPVFITANATSLRKEQWIELDRQVILSARQRLKAWQDLVSKNPYGGFNGMAKLTLEYEAMSDPGEAVVDMDGMTDGRTDSPLFKLRSLPLPITHSDFWFSERRLQVSAGSSTPLDSTMGEAAGRRIGETVEQTTIGVETGVSYGYQSAGVTAHDIAAPADGHGSALGGSTVYGYTNYPHRLTKTNFTAPSTTNGPTTYQEVLTAINQLAAQRFYGPFMLYHSIDWSPYMDNPFSTAGGNHPGETLRTMLMKIPDISGVQRLDFLTSTYTLIFVQQTSDVARGVIGMDITTVQWPSLGGMRKNFKVMAILVPHLRSDYSGRCGILHGTTA